MGMVQVLHYYCKRRRAELLNDITFKKGISCQIQTEFLDISDIVKELTNKNHIDCVAIDEDLFGIGDIEDIISKLEVLKFVTDETKILIIALDRMRNDEMIQGIQKSGVVDYIITKEMIDFDKAAAEPNPQKRVALYKELQDTVNADSPWAPLVFEMMTAGAVKPLKNFAVLPDGSFDFYQADWQE